MVNGFRYAKIIAHHAKLVINLFYRNKKYVLIHVDLALIINH